MRFRIHLSSNARERLGDVAVVLVLALSLIASYACGPETARSEGAESGEALDPPRYTFETIKAPAVTAPVPEETEPESVAVEPEEPVTYAVAEAAYRDGHYREAVELFDRYTERTPDNPWGFYMLGLSARHAGERPRAVAAFERALELDPDHLKSHLNLSRVLLDDGQVERAAEHIERGLALEPESGDAHRLLGRVRAETGDLDGAVDAYIDALVRNEWDVWSMNNLGLVLMQQRRFEEAARALARAVELRDDVAIFQNNLGMALEHLGHFVEAAEAYRTALWLDPAHTRASANFARIDGRPDTPGVTPLDLAALAEGFAAEVVSWRVREADGAGEVEPVEPSVPVIDTTRGS